MDVQRLKHEDRELIATAVSVVNKCEYCTHHHGEALNHYWKDQEHLNQFIQDIYSVSLPEKKRKMLDYVIKLTKNPASMTHEDVQILRSIDFSDEDILSINLITSYFNFVNRVANGLGVEFTPEEVKSYKY